MPRTACELYELFSKTLLERIPTNDIALWSSQNIEFRPPAPFPGNFDPDRHPAQRELMRLLGPENPAKKFTIRAGSQCGKTLLEIAYLLCEQDERPGDFRVVLPDGESSKSFQTMKFRPVLSSIPAFSYLANRDRDREFRAGGIAFDSGHISFRTAGSKQTFAQDSLRVVVLEDVDRAPPQPEGDIVALAESRTRAYSFSGGRVLIISTPTTEDGTVHQEWLKSSQRQFWVPCPVCGAFQVLEPSRMTWTAGDYSTVRMTCAENCGGSFSQTDLMPSLQVGEWRPGKPELVGICEGFYMWDGVVPQEMAPWTDYARAYELAETAEAAGNPKPMQTFVNHRQGLPYRFVSDKRLDEIGSWLARTAAQTPPIDPHSPLMRIHTVGADVQPGWIESLAVGHGRGSEVWVRSHKKHRGSYTDPDHWKAWAQWVVDLDPRPAAVCVDGGWQRRDKDGPGMSVTLQLTALVDFFRQHGVAVWMTIGRASSRIKATSIWPASAPEPFNMQATGEMGKVVVNVDVGKDRVYGSIAEMYKANKTAGPGVIHLHKELTRGFFASLMSERRARKEDRAGSTRYVKRTPKARTEGLDCLVLTLAAFAGLLAILPDGTRAAVARELQLVATDAQPASVTVSVPIAHAPQRAEYRGDDGGMFDL